MYMLGEENEDMEFEGFTEQPPLTSDYLPIKKL
jgi:hypothetical protein